VSFIRKWFIVRVLPGSPEILASRERPASILSSDDLPTFDRPVKPNSGLSGEGHCFKVVLLLTNEAE
jgi:hypothetical protein